MQNAQNKSWKWLLVRGQPMFQVSKQRYTRMGTLNTLVRGLLRLNPIMRFTSFLLELHFRESETGILVYMSNIFVLHQLVLICTTLYTLVQLSSTEEQVSRVMTKCCPTLKAWTACWLHSWTLILPPGTNPQYAFLPLMCAHGLGAKKEVVFLHSPPSSPLTILVL